jgi:histidine ammonia-lyase
MTIHVDTPGDLGTAAILGVARGESLSLSAGLLGRLAASRAETLTALASAGPVYGVNTGMGSQAHLAVGTEEQPSFQGDLMLARSVGGPPWMDRPTLRATVAVRLRTLLEPEAGISPELAKALAALLDADMHVAVPESGYGAAGEIIPLAHLGGFLSGISEGLTATGSLTPAAGLLRDAGLASYTFEAKEGVAFLQGSPAATAWAILLADEVRLLVAQQLTVAAAEVALVRAPRDPYEAALVRGDGELDALLAVLRDLAGDESSPRMLQAPVSFRVVGAGLAHLLRTVAHLDAAIGRALAAVSTSPALVDGKFLGTTGFHAIDLGASADAVRQAVLHVAETGAARVHRLLDPRVTGLPPQLSADPGRQTGLVALHKRVVGLLHQERRTSAPAALGVTDTSSGQEDVQIFALEAMRAASDAAAVLRDVTACELLCVHQATLLDEEPPRGSERLRMVLRKGFEPLADSGLDHPFGREMTALTHLLGVGWAHDALDDLRDAAPDLPI